MEAQTPGTMSSQGFRGCCSSSTVPWQMEAHPNGLQAAQNKPCWARATCTEPSAPESHCNEGRQLHGDVKRNKKHARFKKNNEKVMEMAWSLWDALAEHVKTEMEERGDAWGRVQAVLPGVLQPLEGGQRSTAAPCRSLKTPAPSPLVRPCCLMKGQR